MQCPLSAISSAGRPDFQLSEMVHRQTEAERERESERKGEESESESLAAAAALFVSLMSVRVPPASKYGHKYNKMKMKDT